MEEARILIGAASRPYPGETANGDTWAVSWQGGICRIAVIDGLGHGPPAAAAAERAREVCLGLADVTPDLALQTCHRALAGTRGAAISVARISQLSLELSLAGVGNVEARLVQQGREQRFSPSRGIVGAALPSLQPVHFALDGDWMLVIHTDGIQSRLKLPDPSQALPATPQVLAEALLDRWARSSDDATVVVAMSRPAQPRDA